MMKMIKVAMITQVAMIYTTASKKDVNDVDRNKHLSRFIQHVFQQSPKL